MVPSSRSRNVTVPSIWSGGAFDNPSFGTGTVGSQPATQARRRPAPRPEALSHHLGFFRFQEYGDTRARPWASGVRPQAGRGPDARQGELGMNAMRNWLLALGLAGLGAVRRRRPGA
jgi:hypothetical protein